MRADIIVGMYLQVDGSSVELVEAGDFRRFAVVVVADGELAALDGLGEVDSAGEHVFLEPAAIRGLAGERATGEWGEGFEKMVEFARSKGWVDEAGRVRAHIERQA